MGKIGPSARLLLGLSHSDVVILLAANH